MSIDLHTMQIAPESFGRGIDTDDVRLFRHGPEGVGVFKRFRDDTLRRIRWRRVDRLIAFGRGLARSQDPDDQMLWASCAWPTDVVTEGSRPVGIAERFHGHADWADGVGDVPQGGDRGWRRSCPECGNRARWVRLGLARARPGVAPVHFDFPVKLQRLGELFLVVEALHDRGVTVGDLRDANVLVAPPGGLCRATRSVYLIDTDSFWLEGGSANPRRPGESFDITAQLGTPEWDGQALARLFYALLCETSGAGPAILDRDLARLLLPADHVEAVDALHRGACRLAELHDIAWEWSRLESHDGGLYAARRMGLRFPYRPGALHRLAVDQARAAASARAPRRALVGAGV